MVLIKLVDTSRDFVEVHRTASGGTFVLEFQEGNPPPTRILFDFTKEQARQMVETYQQSWGPYVEEQTPLLRRRVLNDTDVVPTLCPVNSGHTYFGLMKAGELLIDWVGWFDEPALQTLFEALQQCVRTLLDPETPPETWF